MSPSVHEKIWKTEKVTEENYDGRFFTHPSALKMEQFIFS